MSQVKDVGSLVGEAVEIFRIFSKNRKHREQFWAHVRSVEDAIYKQTNVDSEDVPMDTELESEAENAFLALKRWLHKVTPEQFPKI